MATAYGYTRVSGKGQVEGDGEPRQRQAINSFCSANNLAVRAFSFEAGVSGTIEAMDRPAFAELIDLIETSRLNDEVVIVVERMDRLARDLMVQELLLRECRQRHIKVYAADQGLIDLAAEDADPTRKLMRQIFGALAEWEKSALVKKLSAARTRKKQATGRCEGVKPFGFYPGEAAVVARIRELTSVVSTWTDIANALNAEGHKPRRAPRWNRQLVENVCDQLALERKV